MKSILEGEEDGDFSEPLNYEELSDLRLVLGSLVVLAMPLSARALRDLVMPDEDRLKTVLGSLHAVISIPDDEAPIELIQKSFADFLLSEAHENPESFRINATDIHGALAMRCINRMRQGLQKNICKLDSPAHRACNIDRAQVSKYIPADLAYACLYWVHHIARSQNPVDMISSFLEEYLLHLIEALSILGGGRLQGNRFFSPGFGHGPNVAAGLMAAGAPAINGLLSLSLRQESPSSNHYASLVKLLKDAQMFLKEHGPTIQEYPLQVYGSCLVLSHPESSVKKIFAQSRATCIASIKAIRGGLNELCTTISTSTRNSHCVSSLATSPDSKMVAAYTYEDVQVADVGISIVYKTLPADGDQDRSLLALTFSADQLHILGLARNKQVLVWDIRAGEQPTVWRSLQCTDKRFTCGDIIGGYPLAVSVREMTIRLWDLETGTDCCLTHEVVKDTSDIALNSNEHGYCTVAFINCSGDIYLWSGCLDMGEGTSYIGTHPLRNFTNTLAISPCGSILASATADEIWLWKLVGERGIHGQTIHCHTSDIRSIAFFPDGESFAAGGDHISIFKTPADFNCDIGKGRGQMPRIKHIISPNLFSGNRVTEAYCAPIPDPSRVTAMALARNEQTLLTTSPTHPLLVWHIGEGILQHEIPYVTHQYPCFSFSCHGDMLAIITLRGFVELWNVEASSPVLKDIRLGPFDGLSRMEISLDSKSLVTNDAKGLNVWSIDSGGLQCSLEDCNITEMVVSPDGTTLAVVSGDEVFLVSMITGEIGAKVNWESCHPVLEAFPSRSWVVQLSFSETGGVILITIWDEKNQKLETLSWDIISGYVEVAKLATQTGFGGVLTFASPTAKHQKWINYGNQPVCIIDYHENAITVTGDRAVIAEDDGEFTIVDFDKDRVNEI